MLPVRRSLYLSDKRLMESLSMCLCVSFDAGIVLGAALDVYRGADKEDRATGRWRQGQDQVQNPMHPLPLHSFPRRPGEG